ncbi:MBL fold metallo-hydrolase [Membranihabitans marinus]|uniref:MBL fold metallo-hydrolase n=1 Tax=Membranihabitans marinus TaxID=1227546 RepID=UPI001F1F7CF2|nr:MBL fold metallo-hydrolase [Membranihabitans marinus]
MKITTVVSGYFKLDGGAMFGVVPRTLWQKLHKPDELNLCTWAMNSLLIETGNKKILVDTGIGNKQIDRMNKMFFPHGPNTLESLANIAINPEEITDVFLTHLHFDHVGGAVDLAENGNLVLRYPNATYWSNDAHYQWAYKNNAREQASFLKENFVPLAESGQLKMIDVQTEDVHWMDNIQVRFLYGHTHAMMILKIPLDAKRWLWYGADLIPSQWHIRRPYIMAYDMSALHTLSEKERLLTHLATSDDILYFEHDPFIESAQIEIDERGRFALTKSGKLAELIE